LRTYIPGESDIEKKWYHIDAAGQTLGRLASRVAMLIRGKHKVYFTPHMDTGDFVIVTNASKIHVTGRKKEDKMYYRYSGYPGGLRGMNLNTLLKRHPERVIELAVKGMLPKNRLGNKLFKKLKVYAGPEHPHSAQKPETIEI